MNIWELFTTYWEEGLLIFILGSGLIQIAPIKINPWTWIGKKVGKAINGEVLEKEKEIDKKVENHIARDEREHIEDVRVRILRFADEVQLGMNHGKSHYDQILIDIQHYNDYCNNHPDFENNITIHAAKLIEDSYDIHLRNNDFL